MSQKLALIFCLLCAALMFGCFKSQPANNTNSRTANGNSANSTSTANAEKIGVPECDEFIAKYEACITDHVPAAKKTQYRENLAMWSKAWREIMVKSGSPQGVAEACKRHIIASRESMKSFGCEF